MIALFAFGGARGRNIGMDRGVVHVRGLALISGFGGIVGFRGDSFSFTIYPWAVTSGIFGAVGGFGAWGRPGNKGAASTFGTSTSLGTSGTRVPCATSSLIGRPAVAFDIL